MAVANLDGVSVCGRLFTQTDLGVIRGFVAETPVLCRAEVARRTCAELAWVGLDGRPKLMSCRVALLRLAARKLIELPPPRNRNGNGRALLARVAGIEALGPVERSAGAWTELRVRPIEGKHDSRLWNEAIDRFHYLGYTPLPGAQMRYLVEAAEGLLGVLGFGASAWKVACRDRFIGWTPEQRKERLHLVVNNARFLILPWVRSKNLASLVLGMALRRIPVDFEARYGYRPVLAETFVERERFRGTCYRAANWIYLGDTQGRGKLDRHKEYRLPVKQVYVYPLGPGFRKELCS